MQKLASILLVDDDETNNFLNERLLARMDVVEEILFASTSQEALDLLSQPTTAPPALILLDVNMPGMSGIEFLVHYQQQRQAQTQPTVVVMLTTTMDSKDLARINELHVDGLVSKPLTEEKINQLFFLHFQHQQPAA